MRSRRVFLICLSFMLASCATPSANNTAPRTAPEPPPPATIDYTVPNKMFVIAQEKTMGCWATTSAMLTSWKEMKLVTTDEFVARLNDKLKVIYATNAGLYPADQPDLLSGARLRQEAPQNYSVDGWLSMLKSHGPLYVTTAFPDPTTVWGVHTRVVSGIKGDGTPGGTKLHVIDPDGGKESDITITAFTKEMENLAKADGATDIRPMVLHF